MVDSALEVIQEQLREAIRAAKCHRCGCLHKTVETLARTDAGRVELAPILTEAKIVRGGHRRQRKGCQVRRERSDTVGITEDQR